MHCSVVTNMYSTLHIICTTCIPIANILQYLLGALPIIITIVLENLPIIIVNYCIGPSILEPNILLNIPGYNVHMYAG